MTALKTNLVKRLLVVDDDNNFRCSMRRIFHLMPDIASELVTAEDGEEAMRIVSNDGIDCVLMDHQMPKGNGLVWLKRMLEAKPELAIIMVTGAGNEEVAVEAMKNGAMDYLVKGSISPDSLRLAIMNVMDKIGLRHTIRIQNEDLMEAERHRVMIESLGTACHLLGQPATVITTYLELMRRKEASPEMREMIDNCIDAASAMGDILHRLRTVCLYRTEPYCPAPEGVSIRDGGQILEVPGVRSVAQ
jgi:ActR/RegA family two-component response regulator